MKAEVSDWDSRFLPHQGIPVIRAQGGQLLLTNMNFSLIPHWSPERRPKFATHNARLETLSEKPTWRSPLVRKHALIPLSEFIEPIYAGEHSGFMLGFSEQNDGILWAAALWEEWVDKATGEIVPSASIITHDPSEFVATMGHDREPLFLAQPSFRDWLNVKPLVKNSAAAIKEEGNGWIDFLKKAHQEPVLKVRRDRALKKKQERSKAQ